MLKWLLAFIVVVGLIAAGLPPVLGMVYEQQVTAQFENAPRNPVLEIRLADYQRGLYESSGTVVFSLTDEYLDNLEAQLVAQEQADPQTPVTAEAMDLLGFLSGDVTLSFDVQHGPILTGEDPATGLAAFRTTLSPDDGRFAEFQALADVPFLFWLDGTVAFDGLTDFTGGMPAMTGADSDVSFDFSGLDLAGQYDVGQRALQMDGASQSLLVEGPGVLMEFNELTLASSTTLLDEFIWTGDSRLGLGEFALTSKAAAEPVSFVARDAGFLVSADANEAGDRLDLALEYFVGSASGGPDVDLTDMALGIRLSNLDVGGYTQLVGKVQSMDTSTPAANETAMQELMPIITEMLRASPGIELSPVRFISQGESFAADLQVKFNAEDLDEAAFDQLAQNPALAIAAVSADGKMQAPETLMKQWVANSMRTNLKQNLPPDSNLSDEQVAQAAEAQAAMTIETMVAQGMIERTETQLRSDFS